VRFFNAEAILRLLGEGDGTYIQVRADLKSGASGIGADVLHHRRAGAHQNIRHVYSRDRTPDRHRQPQ